MKKTIALVLCLVLAVSLLAACSSSTSTTSSAAASVAASSAASTSAAASASTAASSGKKTKLSIGFYADAADSYYQVVDDTLKACAEADPDCDWTIDYKVGQSTADEQLKAVEDFITAKYDVICVIQNNVETTSECIQKCKDAGIPYFGLCHNFVTASNSADAAGSVCFNFVEGGKFSGQDALKNGVTKVINIEGVLGQGSAGDQSLGFLQAYEEAGKSLGGVTAEELAKQKDSAKLDGTQAVEVVQWASGNWASDPAQKAMQDAITSLGATGFNGIYVQNNPMAEGVMAAMQEAGLKPSDYWIGSMNGREESWKWAEEGTISQDVNQAASLEGCAVYQQIKAYANGETYRKHIHPYLTSYTKSDIKQLESKLIPFTDIDAFMKGKEAGTFVTDINDKSFTDIDGYKD